MKRSIDRLRPLIVVTAITFSLMFAGCADILGGTDDESDDNDGNGGGETYYVLNVATEPPGTGTVIRDPTGDPTTDGFSYLEGTVVTLTPEAASGYAFFDWLEVVPTGQPITDNGDGTWSVTMDGAITMEATFVADGEDTDAGTAADPITITVGTVQTEELAPDAESGTFYYEFTAGETGTYTITSAYETGGFWIGSDIALYDADGNALVDPAIGDLETAFFADLTAGTTYRLQIDHSAGNASYETLVSAPSAEEPITYTPLTIGEPVTEEIISGDPTVYYYEFTVDTSGTYTLTAYTSSSGFFDDADATLYRTDGTEVADPTATETGSGFDIALDAGTTYHLHVDYLYATSSAVTRVEGPTDVDSGSGSFTIY